MENARLELKGQLKKSDIQLYGVLDTWMLMNSTGAIK
jgi:hypothetical protein